MLGLSQKNITAKTTFHRPLTGGHGTVVFVDCFDDSMFRPVKKPSMSSELFEG